VAGSPTSTAAGRSTARRSSPAMGCSTTRSSRGSAA